MADEQNAKQPGDEGGEKKPDETITLSKSELAAVVNAAVTSQLKRTLPNTITEALKVAMAEFKPPQQAEEHQRRSAPQVSASETALRERVAEMEKQYQAMTAAFAQERRSAKLEKARAEALSAVTGHVRKGAERDVVDLMFARGMIAGIDDSDAKPMMKVKKVFGGMEPQDVEYGILEGAREALKDPSWALYLPPPDTRAQASAPNGRQMPRPIPQVNGSRAGDQAPVLTPEQAAQRAVEWQSYMLSGGSSKSDQ